jgi:predicted PurR-regulated permease PerM
LYQQQFSLLVFVFALSAVASLVYTNNVTANTINQVNTMSEQVLSNYNTYFESAITVSDNIQIAVDNLDLNSETNKKKTQTYFDDTMTFKE